MAMTMMMMKSKTNKPPYGGINMIDDKMVVMLDSDAENRLENHLTEDTTPVQLDDENRLENHLAEDTSRVQLGKSIKSSQLELMAEVVEKVRSVSIDGDRIISGMLKWDDSSFMITTSTSKQTNTIEVESFGPKSLEIKETIALHSDNKVELLEEVNNMYKVGMTQDEITLKLGKNNISQTTVSRLLSLK
jgi:hypothetical protein